MADGFYRPLDNDCRIETLCVHGGRRLDAAGAVAPPIYQTSTYAHPGVGRSTGYDYSRTANPTRAGAERVLAALDGAAGALAFSTGMAACSCLMELFKPGDHIIASDDLYGGTHRLFHHISEKNGLSFSFAEGAEGMRALATSATKAIFIETPTNPMMRVIDIRAAAALARDLDALLIVDNTFLTPYFQRPMALGADITLYSATKYLGGHNDTLAGFLAFKDEAVGERLRFIAKTTGGCLAPFDSFLIARGIKTLPVRMERSQETALKIARWLQGRGGVAAVRYPGLETDAGHELCKRQASGFGAMLSFTVDSEATAARVLEGVRIIQYAESLGGTESLITYPMLQTHADVPEAERLAKGIDGRLLRLSVGLEDAGDLIRDLGRAFG